MKIPWVWIGTAVTAVLTLFFHFRAHVHWLPSWLLGVNLATFMLFGADKLAALRRWSRVRELTLHAFALLGGSPAALAAQSLFFHKVSKRKFVWIYWLIVAVQGALVFVLLYTDILKDTLL